VWALQVLLEGSDLQGATTCWFESGMDLVGPIIGSEWPFRLRMNLTCTNKTSTRLNSKTNVTQPS
jgi:hypothetical protein